MKRMFLLLIGGLLLLLAACGQAGTTTESAPAAEAVPQPAETESESSEITQFTVSSTISEAAIVRDSDWVKGADEPLVTIIEYGDFQ